MMNYRTSVVANKCLGQLTEYAVVQNDFHGENYCAADSDAVPVA